MDAAATATIFAAGAVLALVAGWGDAQRRRRPHGRLALLPWHPLLFVGVTAMLLMIVHGLTLLRG